MKYLRIAIDGACRNNGKPNCVSAGGIFVQVVNDGVIEEFNTDSLYETQSTSQRGELLALYYCVSLVEDKCLPAQIITDSEYMFNTVTRRWYESWRNNNWKTSRGDDVKNKDLWALIVDLLDRIEHKGIEFTMYHIKGHVMPYGKVGGLASLTIDSSGRQIYELAEQKYLLTKDSLVDKVKYAQEVSVKNNGFELDEATLKDFVVANVVADLVATHKVEIAKQS